jgi:hypothetical protein
MQTNFGFSKDYYFFHMSNMIQPNFSKFHQFFQNFLKINKIDLLQNQRNRHPPNFFDPHKFSNTLVRCTQIPPSSRGVAPVIGSRPLKWGGKAKPPPRVWVRAGSIRLGFGAGSLLQWGIGRRTRSSRWRSA